MSMCGELENLEHELKVAKRAFAQLDAVKQPLRWMQLVSGIGDLQCRIELLNYLIEEDKQDGYD